MKKILITQLLMITALIFSFYEITRAGTEEAMSALVGTTAKPDYSMVYQYPLMHRDGTVMQLKLIKFNKENCVVIDGEKGCSGGFTEQTSNYKRRYDSEHPVDTTETINLVFTPGKIPKVNEENIMHEVYHAVNLHYMSRPDCETNWRYSTCMENQAYDYTYVIRQIRDLQTQKRIKLI